MEILKKFWGYVTFQKSNNPEKNFNLKVMHGINRVSILLFLLGIVYLVSKYMS